MSKPFSLLLLFALISSIISAPQSYPIPPTRQAFRQQFNNKDFVFDLNKQPNVGGAGGKVQVANVENFPALSGEGLSLTLVTLDACSVDLPFVNPRASEEIYVISGEFLRVGFTEENGSRTIVNDMHTGQVSLVLF